MANNIIKRTWNQNRMVNIDALTGFAFQAESGGHTFEISGIDDTGAVVPLTGTVAGVFRRPDNADIALTGSASNGVASVTLTDDCYAVPGRFGLTIYTTADGQKTAVYAAVGTVAATNGGAVAGDTPQDVVDLINAIEAAVETIPADYTDLMASIAPIYSSSALYPVGSYAWHDGTLYRCTTPITTAETWTAAHWTAVALGDDVSDLKSAFTKSNDAIVNLSPNVMLNGLTWETYHYITSTGKYTTTTNQYSASADYVDISDGEYYLVAESGVTVYMAYYSDKNESSYLSKDNINNSLLSGYTKKIDVNPSAKYARFQLQSIDTTQQAKIYLLRKGDIYNLEDSISEKADKADAYVDLTATTTEQYAMKNDGSNHSNGYKKIFSVSNPSKIKISGYRYSASVPLFVCKKDGNIVGFDLYAQDGLNTAYEVDVPFDVDTIIVNGQTADQISLAVLTSYDYLNKYQGENNSGAVLKVDTNGEVIPVIEPVENYFDGFSLEDLFGNLSDTYYDDFYYRSSFIDADHPYIRIGGQNASEPTIETGVGCYASGLTERYSMSRTFETFPLCFAVGRMEDAFLQISLYATGPNSADMETFAVSATGNVSCNGTAYGHIDEDSKYIFVIVETNRATIFDDTGFSIKLPVEYKEGRPLNYGMYFGSQSGRTYGYGSLVQFNMQKLSALDMSALLNKQSERVTCVRQYVSGSDVPTTSWPGSPYIYVLTEEDDDPLIAYTNNPILKIHDAWDSQTYRTEFKTTANIKNLSRFGSLQRHKFSADYYLPSSDNLASTYTTTIFQIHDSDFYTDGWTDPPPVKIDFNADGKLEAQITSIPDGTIPTGSSSSQGLIVRNNYILCDAPMDEWFNIEVECRVAWRDGMMPYVRICVNGNEKLNVQIPVGYNIISSGGYTHIQTGLYTPSWKSNTYSNMSRTMYITNIKYSY